MQKFLYSSIMTIFIFSNIALTASERMYIDENELDSTENCFHIHMGDNFWIETQTIHRDDSGLYTLEKNIIRNKNKSSDYERKWKCPYCNRYWKVGQACQNEECPSRYK